MQEEAPPSKEAGAPIGVTDTPVYIEGDRVGRGAEWRGAMVEVLSPLHFYNFYTRILMLRHAHTDDHTHTLERLQQKRE